MAETTQDEREPEQGGDEREPESSEEQREPKASGEEREPKASEEDREQDEGEEDRKPEPPDLPEAEEKSADDLLGSQVVDPHGYTIGKIDALFIHGEDERARWARIKTGIVRKDFVFVPLHDAQEDGRQIRVVYEKEHVNDAPEIEPDGNELSDDDADLLHSHYGLERVKGLTKETAEKGDIDLPREARDANPPTMKEPPWSVEKYPLPDMERPEEGDSSGQEGEESSARQDEESSDRQDEESSDREGEESSAPEDEDS